MKLKKFLITAGPTREPIDPVRYLSNRSTGQMGYAIAQAAEKKGYHVTLITGPTTLQLPENVKCIQIETAKQMFNAVKEHIKKTDCLVMSAAVADFTPKKYETKKIKKDKFSNLKLVKTVDILKSIKNVKIPCKVGFALETDKSIENAKAKIKDKGLDLIVMNTLSDKNDPFGKGSKTATLLFDKKDPVKIEKKSKEKIAAAILDTIEAHVL